MKKIETFTFSRRNIYMAISVLIVEDDRNIQELLQMYLEKEGYAVTVADDGGQGLTKFRAIRPDLVLLDVMMPVMDGWTVCKMIRSAGIRPLEKEARYWCAKEIVTYKSGTTTMVVMPHDSFRISATVEFADSMLGTQFMELDITPESFEKELAPCRTFASFSDLKQLMAAGLARGGSLDNANIMHNGAIISNGGLRFPNELVRHKTMDMVGDLYLTGKRLKAHVVAIRSGHPSNVETVRRMLLSTGELPQGSIQ
jgi:UDP-3-O-acyl-N-acetylglucosamine deacetylase